MRSLCARSTREARGQSLAVCLGDAYPCAELFERFGRVASSLMPLIVGILGRPILPQSLCRQVFEVAFDIIVFLCLAREPNWRAFSRSRGSLLPPNRIRGGGPRTGGCRWNGLYPRWRRLWGGRSYMGYMHHLSPSCGDGREDANDGVARGSRLGLDISIFALRTFAAVGILARLHLSKRRRFSLHASVSIRAFCRSVSVPLRCVSSSAL